MLRKPCRLQTDGQTDGRTDKVNPVYPPSNFVGRGIITKVSHQLFSNPHLHTCLVLTEAFFVSRAFLALMFCGSRSLTWLAMVVTCSCTFLYSLLSRSRFCWLCSCLALNLGVLASSAASSLWAASTSCKRPQTQLLHCYIITCPHGNLTGAIGSNADKAHFPRVIRQFKTPILLLGGYEIFHATEMAPNRTEHNTLLKWPPAGQNTTRYWNGPQQDRTQHATEMAPSRTEHNMLLKWPPAGQNTTRYWNGPQQDRTQHATEMAPSRTEHNMLLKWPPAGQNTTRYWNGPQQDRTRHATEMGPSRTEHNRHWLQRLVLSEKLSLQTWLSEALCDSKDVEYTFSYMAPPHTTD